MSEKIYKDLGGPAFPTTVPTVVPDGRGGVAGVTMTYAGAGMSLRDWFAGQVIAGISDINITPESRTLIAECAYAMADAMLKVRDEKK